MTGAKFEKLVEIMARLRGPDGCPWDKQQDRNSLKPMLVEETYEVLEAIDNNDSDGLSEELGDLLLHVVFQAQLGKETGGSASTRSSMGSATSSSGVTPTCSATTPHPLPKR